VTHQQQVTRINLTVPLKLRPYDTIHIRLLLIIIKLYMVTW